MLVVTGGAGFIGSALVWALNQRGRADIVVVDTLGSGNRWKNLRGRQFLDIVEPVQFSEQLLGGKYDGLLTGILHMGAITDTAETDVDALYNRNTRYTRSLAVWAMDNNVRFVYASSASVYGDGADGFADSDTLTPDLLPLNPYAFSKWLFDCEAIRNQWIREIAGLRFFNVFGPNEYHKGRMASVVWHAVNQLRATGQIQLFQSHRSDYNDGEQLRDFVYVKDVCNIVLWFLDNSNANGIYNVGTGKARPFNDLASAIFSALELPPDIVYIPTPESIRDAYQYFTQADLSNLRDAGCDLAFLSLETAVEDYVSNYLLHASAAFL